MYSRPIYIFLLLFLCVAACPLYAQQGNPAGKATVVPRPYYLPVVHDGEVYADTGVRASSDTLTKGKMMPYTRQEGRKGYSSFIVPSDKGVVMNVADRPKPAPPPLLTIHGNVLYSVDYRSYIDTPYMEHDVYYHTVQTYLDITCKNNYPVRVYLTNHFSNSSLIRKYTDLSMMYTSNDFASRLRQLISKYPLPNWQADSLAGMEKQLNIKRNDLLQEDNWLNSAYAKQRLRLIKEHEKYGGEEPGMTDSLPSLPVSSWQKPNLPAMTSAPDYFKEWLSRSRQDTAAQVKKSKPVSDSAFLAGYNERRRRADSLKQEVVVMEQRYYQYRSQVASLKGQQSTQLNNAGSAAQLEAEIKARNVPDSALPAGYKTLLAVKSFGIGRTVVDYSELSVKNVSINGLQVEYNPSYYVAVAAGTIDYRFRDFIVKNSSTPAQYLYMVRAGRGIKNGTNIIVSWYAGKKQVYNNTSTSTAASPDYSLMGFTVEGNYRVSRNVYLTGEVAKSSLPYYSTAAASKSLLAAATRFSEHGNEAYSVKMQAQIPASRTNITAYYKRYGASFQSFSFSTTGVEQKAWMIKADQPFFRRRLTLTASLKENDYNNTGTSVTYQNNTVFKSIQATLRLPKWPVLTLGYYPSSQLTKLSDSSYTESMFYTLMASSSYYYKVSDINMSTTAMYTRFYNKLSDSGFVYSNTSNILLNHALFFPKLTWQTTGSASLAAYYNLYTVDNSAQYNVLSWLSVGVGIKYNYQTYYNIAQTGYKENTIIKMKKLGQVQLMMEKGFIPGANKQLVENNTGRFSYFKIF